MTSIQQIEIDILTRRVEKLEELFKGAMSAFMVLAKNTNMNVQLVGIGAMLLEIVFLA